MAETSTENAEHGFWDFKKYQEHEWFRFLVIVLIVTVALYLVSHIVVRQFDRKAGYEYETLGEDQMQHINRIYFANDSTDTTNGTTVPLTNSTPAYRSERAVQYIQNHFNKKVDSEQLAEIQAYLGPAPPLEAVSFWGSVRLRIRSYFWLVGPEVYFEIIFWTLLGVITSLLFNLGVVGRSRTTDQNNANSVFDSSEIPYQFAKLWYAPIITLVIVLGYNFFEGDNIADISSSKGVIVFAFVGGFYSARLIAFLDRLKEVLLPANSTVELPVQKPSAVPLTNVSVSLQLEDDSLSPDLVNEITEIGFGIATVTLENEENGKIITAEKSSEDQTAAFTVASIAPGKYVVRATWSNEVNGQVINLAGEEKKEITQPDTAITVVLKKSMEEG